MAVVLVALAATISALAYNTATVTNGFSMTVAYTGAALDVQPASGVDSGVQAMSARGYVNITMNDKIGQNASYVYDPIIKIKNNTTDPVKVWVDFSSLPTGMTVTFCDSTTAECLTNSAPASTNFTAGQERVYKMTVATNNAVAAGAVTPTITVYGSK
jgi:hypothetical protein